MNLKQDVIRVVAQGVRIKLKAITILKNLPDNPKIKWVGNKYFTINSSNLKDNWSPEFHNWRAQYKLLITVIAKTPVELLANKLNEITDRGSIKLPGYTQKLHPEVIKLLNQHFN